MMSHSPSDDVRPQRATIVLRLHATACLGRLEVDLVDLLHHAQRLLAASKWLWLVTLHQSDLHW